MTPVTHDTPTLMVLTQAHELVVWWRGVADDELEIAKRAPRGDARALEREKIWRRCAEQLELVLACKPFNPDP